MSYCCTSRTLRIAPSSMRQIIPGVQIRNQATLKHLHHLRGNRSINPMRTPPHLGGLGRRRVAVRRTTRKHAGWGAAHAVVGSAVVHATALVALVLLAVCFLSVTGNALHLGGFRPETSYSFHDTRTMGGWGGGGKLPRPHFFFGL